MWESLVLAWGALGCVFVFGAAAVVVPSSLVVRASRTWCGEVAGLAFLDVGIGVTAVIVVGTFFVEIETSRFWAVVITRRNHDIVRVGAVVVLVGFHKQIPMVDADT